MAAHDPSDALGVIAEFIGVATRDIAKRLQVGRLKEPTQMHGANVQFRDDPMQLPSRHTGLLSPQCWMHADGSAIDGIGLREKASGSA